MTENKIEIQIKHGFDIKIWAYKVGKWLALVFITGLIISWQEDPKYILIIPVLKGLANWLKYK